MDLIKYYMIFSTTGLTDVDLYCCEANRGIVKELHVYAHEYGFLQYRSEQIAVTEEGGWGGGGSLRKRYSSRPRPDIGLYCGANSVEELLLYSRMLIAIPSNNYLGSIQDSYY